MKDKTAIKTLLKIQMFPTLKFMAHLGRSNYKSSKNWKFNIEQINFWEIFQINLNLTEI